MFLFDYGGNPNKRNRLNESSLHCACQLANNGVPKDISAHEQCVSMLVGWKGSMIGDGSYEKLDLSAQDTVGNSFCNGLYCSLKTYIIYIMYVPYSTSSKLWFADRFLPVILIICCWAG